MAKVKIRFEPEGRQTSAQTGETILKIAQRVGLELRSDCGGQGSCGKCRVLIEPLSTLNAPTPEEMALLSPRYLQAGFRLACQVHVPSKGNFVVTIPTATRGLRRRVQLDGILQPFQLTPAVESVLVRVARIDPNECIPDTERVLTSLAINPRLSATIRWEYPLPIITKTPSAVRKADGEVTVVIRNSVQILDILAGDARENVYGVALDIGTSKIVGSLYSLTSGDLLRTEGIENPQLRFGEDIMSRLSYAGVSQQTRKELQNAVIEGVNSILNSLVASGFSLDRIYELVVVGNTVMTSLFLGLDTTHLAYGPFVPPFRGPIEVAADQLNLIIPPQSIIHVLPNIAGYVGADAIADIIATGLHTNQAPCLLIDIGTNSEVILGNKDRISATSCAAGPAFEGAQIEHGMKAVSGAIERVTYNSDSGQFNLTTIDNKTPNGICGSGVVDVIAELAHAGFISSKGRFTSQAQSLIVTKGKLKAITLFKGTSKKKRFAITISEQDISNLLLAKAAIQTGYSLVLQHQQLSPADLNHVFIAGAFGNYLNMTNAQRIGLIPPVPLDRVSFIGNAALSGAQMALLSMSHREQAISLARSVKFVDLARHPDFSQTYAASLFL
ncbi:MAG: ASKHA domain-containing protein [Promethearchaeota archaeon]